MYRKDAPEIPYYTCNSIDHAIKECSRLISDYFEELREANADLRMCVEYWKTECEKVDEELNELDKKYGLVCDDLEVLKYELDDIKSGGWTG